MKKIGALLVILMFISSMIVVAEDTDVEDVIVSDCGLLCTAGKTVNKWLFGDAEARALAGTAWFDRTDALVGMGGDDGDVIEDVITEEPEFVAKAICFKGHGVDGCYIKNNDDQWYSYGTSGGDFGAVLTQTEIENLQEENSFETDTYSTDFVESFVKSDVPLVVSDAPPVVSDAPPVEPFSDWETEKEGYMLTVGLEGKEELAKKYYDLNLPGPDVLLLRDNDISLEEYGDWATNGFAGAEEIVEWKTFDFDLTSAYLWSGVVPNVVDADKWRGREYSPDQVALLNEKGITTPEGAETALASAGGWDDWVVKNYPSEKSKVDAVKKVKKKAAVKKEKKAEKKAEEDAKVAPKIVTSDELKAAKEANQAVLQSQVQSLLGYDLYQKYGKQIEDTGGIQIDGAPAILTTQEGDTEVTWTKTDDGLYEGTVGGNEVIGHFDPSSNGIVIKEDVSGSGPGPTKIFTLTNYDNSQFNTYTVPLGKDGSGMVIEPLEGGQVKNILKIMKTEEGKPVLDEENSGDLLLSGESQKPVTNQKGETVQAKSREIVVFQSNEEKKSGTLTIDGETVSVGSDNLVDDLANDQTINIIKRIPTEVKAEDGKSSTTTYKKGNVIGDLVYDKESEQKTVRRFDTKVETTNNFKTREKMLFDLDGKKNQGNTLKRNEGILYNSYGHPTHLLGVDGDDITMMDVRTGLYAGVITKTDTYGTVKMVQTDYNEMEYYTENGESVGRFTLDNNGNWRNKEGINPETALSRKTNPPTLTLENKKALAIANNIEIVNQNMKEAQTKKATSDAGITTEKMSAFDPSIASKKATIDSLLLKVKTEIHPELAQLKHIAANPKEYTDVEIKELYPGSDLSAEQIRIWIRDTGIPELQEEIVKAIADQKTAEANIKELLREKSALETQKAAIEAGEYPGLPEDWSSIDNPDTQSALISAAATTEGVNSRKYLESNGLLKSVGKFKNKDNAEVEVFTSYDGNLYTSDGTFIGDDDVLVSSAGTSSGLATATEAAKKATAEHLGEIEEDIKAAKDEVKKAGPLSDSEEISGKSTEIKQNSFVRGAQIGVNSVYAITGELGKTYSSLNQLWQDEQWYKDWTGVFDKQFAPALGSQWFPSAICEGNYDIEPEGTAMIKTVSGTYQAIAHIEAEVTPDQSPVLCSRNPDAESDEEWICGKEQVCVEDNFCYADADGDKEPDNDQILEGYFYKITWAVSAPRDETFTPYRDENGVAVSFNVILYNGADELPLYKRGGDSVGPIELNNGERDSDVFTQFSANPYNEVCIVWENAPSSVEIKKNIGDTVHGVGAIDDVCFKIVPSTVGVVTWQKSSKDSSSHKVSNNDPEMEVTEI
jgi:hypothetical protein